MISQTRIIMGMPVTIAVVDALPMASVECAFAFFEAVDERFSTWKAHSEISRFNRGEFARAELSADMREVLAIADETQAQSGGYFDIRKPDGALDPSGIVKGWAIRKAARMLEGNGAENFYVDAGGDVQAQGHNPEGGDWRVGIRSPFQVSEIIKVVNPRGAGVATSGSYIRGQHIWNPHAPKDRLDDVVSITVIGPDVLEADRFATAAFAMGPRGVYFIESLPGFEAYQVNAQGRARMTSHFQDYVA